MATTSTKRSSSRRPTRKERLRRYDEKRDFDVTPEPKGSRGRTHKPPKGTSRFVVQRHRARALHYDLRLEMDGVLVSWAVPKGPTLDPAAKRMAVHVEDHPLEYFDFEGVIPKGEYGAGDVIVWDWGTWTPVGTDDPSRSVADGELHFELTGEKLRGRFAIIRRGRGGDREQWLLIHKRDDHAVDGWDAEDHLVSVRTGRTNDEVADKPNDRWTRDRPTTAAWARRLDVDPVSRAELRALDAMRKDGPWEVAGVEVRLTNLDKPLFPARRGGPPITKRDLIRHAATVGPAMIPYLAGRPVNPHRFPDGVEGKSFWHKAVPDYAPDWITRFRYEDAGEGETEWYAVVDSIPTLVWMANHGAIELHPWTSRVDDVHEPTWALIDVDPGTATSWSETKDLACLYRTALEHLGVEGGPKVTGKRGLQIWVPIRSGYTFDDTRAWVEQVSRAIGKTVPDLVSWSWRKAERGGLARLDYTQNAINKTLVAPFSTRPSAGAPVSVPITWDELDDPHLRPDRWTIKTIGKRLAEAGDPLRPLIGLQQTLPEL